MRICALALALSLPLAACAPERTAGTGGDDPVPSNDFETALFTIVDHGGWLNYQSGHLVLVDAEMACNNLQWDGSLDKWSVGAEVDWVQANIQHGTELPDWLRTYESVDRAAQSGSQDTPLVQSFWGEVGLGPLSDDFPDDPDGPTDPVNEEREVLAAIGTDQGVDDRLAVSLDTELSVAGELTTWQGDWSFSATHCGIVYEQIDGGTDPGGGEDSGGGDSGSP